MKISHKFASGMFTAMILLGGLGLGVVASQELHIFKGRAEESKGFPPLPTQPVTTTISYASSKYGYSLNFDHTLWNENNIAQGKQDLKNLSFDLNHGIGRAAIQLQAYSEKELEPILASQASTGKDALETVALSIQNNKPTSPKASVVNKERVTKNEKDRYKLTIEEPFLTGKITYYQYIFVEEKNYFVVTAKYIPGDSAFLAEQLIDSFSFSRANEAVKGTSTETTERTLDESEITELTSPSVVNILNIYCTKAKVTIPPVLNATVSAAPIQYFKPSGYEFCTAGKGSGSFITKDGYIATNGHVAKFWPIQSFLTAAFSKQLRPLLIDIYRHAYLQVNNKEITATEVEQVMDSKDFSLLFLLYFVDIIPSYLDNHSLVIEDANSKYFIKLGNTPFPINQEKAAKGDIMGALDNIKETDDIKEAAMVGYNFPNNDSMDVYLKRKAPKPGPDVAILKIQNTENLSFPGLKLKDIQEVKEGSSLVIIGYPGLVEGTATASSLLNFKSSSKPTITKGIISAIKEDQDGRKIIQTDASVEHGNSGGPGFDKYGNIIGMATYAEQSQSGQYNFLRSNSELQNLMKDNHVAINESPAFTNWQTGLTFYWDGYYRKALPHLKKVKEQYPIHPSVDSYITKAQTAIKEGKDKEGIWGAVTEVIPTAVIAAISALLVVIGVGGIFFLIKRKKHLLPPPPALPQTTIPGTSIPMPQ